MTARPTRYVVVGLYNATVGYLLFFLINLAFGKVLHYLAVLALSYALSITHAYIGQRLLVFRSTARWWPEYLRFFAINLFAMGANAVLLVILINCGMGVMPAQAISVTIVTLLSYFGHRHFSFRAE